MDFELEWELKLFREEQQSLFDETGERYSATPVGDGTAKRMLNLINLLESALIKQSEQQSNCNLPQVSDNEVADCPCNKLLIMNEKAEKSAKKNINEFVDYYEKQGFNVIKKNYSTYKASLEHSDGRYIEMLVSGIGIDFTIKGYNFAGF